MAHHDVVENNPKKEILTALIGIVLLLAMIAGIAVFAWLRPAGDHHSTVATPEVTEQHKLLQLLKQELLPILQLLKPPLPQHQLLKKLPIRQQITQLLPLRQKKPSLPKTQLLLKHRSNNYSDNKNPNLML